MLKFALSVSPKVAKWSKVISGQIQDGGRYPKLDMVTGHIAITQPRIVRVC